MTLTRTIDTARVLVVLAAFMALLGGVILATEQGDGATANPFLFVGLGVAVGGLALAASVFAGLTYLAARATG